MYRAGLALVVCLALVTPWTAHVAHALGLGDVCPCGMTVCPCAHDDGGRFCHAHGPGTDAVDGPPGTTCGSDTAEIPTVATTFYLVPVVSVPVLGSPSGRTPIPPIHSAGVRVVSPESPPPRVVPV